MLLERTSRKVLLLNKVYYWLNKPVLFCEIKVLQEMAAQGESMSAHYISV